ncbi:ferric reductase-like transmembrane domain-containing protein [Roseibium album]|uniref:Ferric reductase like transmembrane component n=1 Tax=Roseibium album TaxID=311410 RepID=A0A0M7AJL1_9HYPH|nr:ferric reductase-like transmembrane domain-containing protein [Roseibium album]CTQ60470.1 Ferric reductase like transmembrane component [Roseibium album]CTQ66031.1 Ferric reductase like transmembrane component [Roseibium album]CTQ73963.1 Ferric reductase like transmembrane component [Roseibium album]
MGRTRAILIWGVLAAVLLIPVAAAAASPLLQWRQPVYIAAGFAGIIAMALLLVQPLLAGGYLPGLARQRGRRLHRWVGGVLVLAVIVHVAGLWITSPPDVIDALLFRSPTPFSVWGVIAMWAVFAAALLAAIRRRLQLRPRTWRLAHTSLVLVIVAGSVIHALLIEGTMETVTKVALCGLVLAAFLKAFADLKVWTSRHRRDA